MTLPVPVICTIIAHQFHKVDMQELLLCSTTHFDFFSIRTLSTMSATMLSVSPIMLATIELILTFFVVICCISAIIRTVCLLGAYIIECYRYQSFRNEGHYGAVGALGHSA